MAIKKLDWITVALLFVVVIMVAVAYNVGKKDGMYVAIHGNFDAPANP